MAQRSLVPALHKPALVYDILVLVALVVIGIWCVWHPGYFEDSSIENKVMLTWMWAGLIPAAGLSFVGILEL